MRDIYVISCGIVLMASQHYSTTIRLELLSGFRGAVSVTWDPEATDLDETVEWLSKRGVHKIKMQ